MKKLIAENQRQLLVLAKKVRASHQVSCSSAHTACIASCASTLSLQIDESIANAEQMKQKYTVGDRISPRCVSHALCGLPVQQACEKAGVKVCTRR